MTKAKFDYKIIALLVYNYKALKKFKSLIRLNQRRLYFNKWDISK